MPTILDNQTITIPAEGWPASGVVYQSPILPAQNVSQAKFVCQIHDLDPDADADPGEVGDYLLELVVEESLDDGASWHEIAECFDQVKGTKKALAHVIEYNSNINVNPGQILRSNGNPPRNSVSHTQGSIQSGAKYRFMIYRTRTGNDPDLQSITLTVNYSFT